MYIYHLPHLERKELCRILDQNDKWEELCGIHMKYDLLTLQELRREFLKGNSPTDELLTLWGHQNHTVLELFILLSRMQHYQAMTVLKRFIDPKYHQLIHEEEHNLNRLIERLTLNKRTPCSKNLKIPPENNENVKILNIIPTIKQTGATISGGCRNALRLQLLQQQQYKQPPMKINATVEAPIVSKEDNESEVVNRNLLLPRSPVGHGQLGTSRGFSVSDISCVAESAGAIPQIPYEELQKATDNWNSIAILGKGGFGTVFKGIWKCTQVAIKRIEQREDNPESHSEQIKQSITELQCLNAIRHDNVLPLYGYSIGGAQPCLVYQYMPGGALDHRLRTRDPTKLLTWKTRLHISIGTARGLQFLHNIGEKPLIHGDIKSANILLDDNDNAKIGDFGLAREGPQSNYTHIKVSRIHGTRPYLPDEFLRAKKVSTKVDTYSFGVVLFEIATALTAYSDQRQNKFLSDHVVNYEGDVYDLKDHRVMENGDECFKGLIDIGKLCVSKRAKDRPEMVDVLRTLETVNL